MTKKKKPVRKKQMTLDDLTKFAFKFNMMPRISFDPIKCDHERQRPDTTCKFCGWTRRDGWTDK